ncbi:hypothetical protein Ccrd_004133 [Cynara cardunculus var. scolymus]|uniref:Uncharacterized protein n=1 Tax=Cynara cardunculus var. scolymus TaxID=59895 RepID=A0A103XNI1_CYNCS|nr:hypothetical protein Ccrd_004133 [Cynara cardunculus var. scolymus]
MIISVPRPHCWKGSTSKPYVELPLHMAPLGMEVGPAQACAVKSGIPKKGKEFIAPPRHKSSSYRAWTMSPEQSQYIWRKTIPHIKGASVRRKP